MTQSVKQGNTLLKTQIGKHTQYVNHYNIIVRLGNDSINDARWSFIRDKKSWQGLMPPIPNHAPI